MRSANLFFFTQPQEMFEAWYQAQQNTPFEEKEEPFFVEFQQIPINYGTTTDTAYQDSLYWKEQHLYGSSRLGIAKPELEVTNYTPSNFSLLTSNFRNYELTNHLGNVLSTIKDEKQQIDQNADGIVDYYEPIVITANDYYPFGMVMPNRSFSLGGSNYRFGFNGQEKDDEIKGSGNSISYEARMYDPRLGRWLSTDALADKYPAISPFAFALNTPIMAKDPDGNVVIFINGQHAGNGGTSAYWGGYDSKAMDKMGDHSARYVDGALGGWKNTGIAAAEGAHLGGELASVTGVGTGFGMAIGATLNVATNSNVNRKVRIAAGAMQGKKDAADIYANLKEGESVKIVTHSMGTAYSRGYVKGLKQWAKENGKTFNIEYQLDVNAFQGGDLPKSPLVKQTQSKTGGLDGGNSFGEMIKGNSVPTVAPVPGAENTTDPADATKGHAVDQMSTSKIPNLGNGGNAGSVEQGSNNENRPK